MTDELEALVKKKDKDEHESIPIWIKLFGGSIISVLFLCVITVIGYVVNNLNSLQIQINNLNAQMITKEENNQQHKTIWDTFMGQSKSIQEAIGPIKERINGLEQLLKERQTLLDKVEARQSLQDKSVEGLHKDHVVQKEKIAAQDVLLGQLREEIRALQKDLQTLRERIAAIEGKIPDKKP